MATIKRDADAFYLGQGTQIQQLMLQHKKRKAYLWVAQLMSIYSGKRPNEHAIILDAHGKRVDGTGEKMEACAAFFEKFYNCALTIKLPTNAEPEEPRPPPEPPLASELPPIYSNAWAYGLPLPGKGETWGLQFVSPLWKRLALR
jgi:hypothetical protein